MAAAVEPWQAAGARRKRRSAARRPRGGAAAAGRLEAEPEADSRAVLRRIREAEGEETETQSPQICGPSTVYGALHPCQPVVWTEGTEQTQTRPWELGHPPATPGTPAALISGRRQHWSGSGRVHCESCLSHCGALCLGHSIPFPTSSSRSGGGPPVGRPGNGWEMTMPCFLNREDLLLSDFWSLALETINGCLTQQLAQLETPGRALSEALGNLHLHSLPDASDAAPGSVPGDTLVPGSRHLKCVCYGLGNFATCVIARNQLAFLLLFLEKCQIPRRHCWVYDPLFSQLEIAVLDGLGVTVLSENEEGRRCVGGEPTVFYMPHCGTALYNNLLWSNWSAGALSRMLVVGNSFRGLEERLLSRVLHKNYPYVAKVLQGLEERGLPQTPPYADVFNDMSVHWFPAEKLLRLPPDTWAFREEPDYGDCEDLEIIRSRTSGPSAASPTGP